MEVFIRNIPYTFDELQLNRALAQVLHGSYFREHMGGAPFNFIVRIFKARNPRQRQHGGSGILIVPSFAIGSLFIQLARLHVVTLHGRVLYAEPGRAQPKPEDVAFLVEPYQDPTIVEEQRRRNAEIKGEIKLQNLQFGWPCHDWAISIEWESPAGHHPWILEFDPETRRFAIKSQSGLRVVVALNNVQSMAIDSHACVIWLERPPILEREKDSITQLTELLAELGIKNTGPTRERLVTLDETRGNIFAFLRVIRIAFNGQHSLQEFKSKATMMGITTYEGNYGVSNLGLFDPYILEHFQEWLRGLSFDLAFQIDGLVSRCRFNPKELRRMKHAINAAVERYGEAVISDSIRLLEQRRDDDREGRTASDLFRGILADLDRNRARRQIRQSNQSGEIFQCHRVAVTPTSLILSGPLPDETNRVLRRYMNYQSHFIRVEFRDEDRLHLRLDREVDQPKFLEERIGTILQEGLVIAGRNYEFLAYSSSALKEHAVWFIHPFIGDDELLVDAESIRASLGDFTKVIHCPARYGARIAQAFSTTEPSITAEAEEMIAIPDRTSRSGSLFTDGVGTISLEIAEEIWEQFTETRSKRSRRRLQTPSAYQIRLGGLKGMLCVDERLEGRVICTRPSMAKFTAPDLAVEIAHAFDRPITMYLNRPLIMLLETLGVPLQPIVELQRDAVRQTNEAAESLETAARLLEQNGLGTAFRMTSIFLNLHKLHADLETRQDSEFISFLKRVLKFAVNHVLRDLKYKARIRVPDAWTLVGVADEYNYLEADEIYAYVCTIDGRKEYIEGDILISRSPTVHPGDARMVRAIGRPPPNAPPGLGRLTNCVVFSCKGERSLPSMLAGGDLDGDIYCLISDPNLHPAREMQHDPASYDAPALVTIDRPSTAADIAKFVVDFIKNDLLGVIATQILLTADISEFCMADPDCVRLAALHSDAVDFPKTGRHVSFRQLPKAKSKRKPDWYANETNERRSEFYQSTRHIGHLFRDISLPAVPEAQRVARRQNQRLEAGNGDITFRAVMNAYSRNTGLISRLMKRKMDDYVDLEYHASGNISGEIEEMLDIFDDYSNQLEHTCRTHSLSKWAALTEEEIVAGTIVAKCSQPRMRSDTISAMRRDSTSLATAIREAIEGPEGTEQEKTILRAWTAWKVSTASGAVFGARSFGLMAMDIIFSTVRRIDTGGPY